MPEGLECMKTIQIKTNDDMFYRQFLETIRSIPPINKLRSRELDVLAEIMRKFDMYKDYPDEHKIAVVFGTAGRKEICDKININIDSLNNNLSLLRKSKILSNDNNLHSFFRNISFNKKFELNFIFKE